MNWLPLIALGMTAFAATNLDDAFVLLLFFGDRRYRARHVFVGQAAGVGLLVALSLVGALAALALPARAVGLLGLLPIAIGAKQLIERRRERHAEPAAGEVPQPRAAGWRQAAAVAGVTLANGGDNVGIYVPLFAARPPGEIALLLAVFAVMLVAWTAAGYLLARRSALAGRLRRVSGAVMPWVLVGLGLAIMAEATF
jgi:cadmium resistance protein CadD (predicted permease)